MSATIRQVEGGWLWEVECDDADHIGTCETREEAEAAAARAVAAEAEVARWRAPQGEIDMLIPYVERVLLAAEMGARLAPDIAAEWMPRARSALAAMRARDIGASAALRAAQLRFHAAEAEHAAAEQRGADRMREAIAVALSVQAEAARLRGVKIAGMADAEHAAFLALGNTATMAAFDRAVEIARAGGVQ